MKEGSGLWHQSRVISPQTSEVSACEKQTSRRYRTLQARCAAFGSSWTRNTECVSRAVFSKPSMACRSFRMLGRSSAAQSTILFRSRPSVNLFPFRIAFVTEFMARATASLSLLYSFLLFRLGEGWLTMTFRQFLLFCRRRTAGLPQRPQRNFT